MPLSGDVTDAKLISPTWKELGWHDVEPDTRSLLTIISLFARESGPSSSVVHAEMRARTLSVLPGQLS